MKVNFDQILKGNSRDFGMKGNVGLDNYKTQLSRAAYNSEKLCSFARTIILFG